jgi:hypothetical protein
MVGRVFTLWIHCGCDAGVFHVVVLPPAANLGNVTNPANQNRKKFNFP